jgi:putative glutamine amidotransferase
MPKPLIGITAGKKFHEAKRSEEQSITISLETQYIESAARAGAAVLVLPGNIDEASVGEAVSALDGIILSGGGDVMPLAYGQEPHPASLLQDPMRDRVEIAAIKGALAKGLPILGICRGIQILNVAMGGTLIQDIPSQVSGACQHYSRAEGTTGMHTMEIEAGTLLSQVLGKTSLAVNSYHHQSIDKLGKGLRINARARDGVIEGVESDDGRPILAVQCHPEAAAAIDPAMQALFAWLCDTALRNRKSGTERRLV